MKQKPIGCVLKLVSAMQRGCDGAGARWEVVSESDTFGPTIDKTYGHVQQLPIVEQSIIHDLTCHGVRMLIKARCSTARLTSLKSQ